MNHYNRGHREDLLVHDSFYFCGTMFIISSIDGHHVFAYQETNEALEIIVLTVTLSGLTLSVQADKPSKNNYEVYLSFDEL